MGYFKVITYGCIRLIIKRKVMGGSSSSKKVIAKNCINFLDIPSFELNN